jgi:alpha-L-glutamate ligase-like protein
VGDVYRTPGGRLITWSELRHHFSTIITGLYSLGGQPDVAIIEQRIVTHPSLQSVVVGGTPDIRVVLYQAVPVLAMLRMPTQLSGGRANLHQGAVAVGINLLDGITFGGVLQNRIVTHHPDTEAPLAGLEIPDWHKLLDASMKLADALELGYVGVDFVIDANRGAVVLEANARPGLAIQVANRCGMLNRLRWVKANARPRMSIDERHELVRRLVAEV